jgi:hypothetical protein
MGSLLHCYKDKTISNMKKIRIFLLITVIVALSAVFSLNAQRGGGGHGGGGYHEGGGRGYNGGGGYHHDGDDYHGYNHFGYGARPYYGVATVPFGFGYYGSNCGYVGYWHQWRCW